MDKDKNEKNKENLIKVAIASASYETIQRYGNAAKQHYSSYSGVDNEISKTLVKGLKQISNEKVNIDYKFQNIHQQAGFSAEVKDVARTNAEKIIKGDKTRKIRTDDLGKVNDPLYDTVLIDEHGNIINDSGAQMKFLGISQKDPTGTGDAARALEKLQSKKFEKYLDNDVKIDVPSDQYDSIIKEANDKIIKLSEQLENQSQAGKVEQVNKIQEKIDKLEKIKTNIKKSSVSSDDAVFARLHPKLSTAIDVAKISNKAGIQTAKTSIILGGSVSIVKNLVSVFKGETEPEDAVLSVAKDTSLSVVTGYATGFTGTALKGAMQNASSNYIRTLSKTNIPGMIITVSLNTSKTLKSYFNGDIDGVECLEALGEQGTGMMSSAMFAAVGQAMIPIPVIGGLIGGMFGYAISSASYGILTQSLKEEKIAHEQRVLIENACREHIKLIRQYRAEMEEIINKYLIESMSVFRDSFSGISNAFALGDADWFIDSANEITETFGGKKSFDSIEEFDEMMLTDEIFKL